MRSPNGLAWSMEFIEVGAMISAVLCVMHPDQYRVARSTLGALCQHQRVKNSAARWPTVWSAITLVSNRCCPLHRDVSGSFALFDLLVSTGKYSTAPLELQPLGIQIPNGPGTMCGVSGKAFRHGVAHADGPRRCHAFYMRASLPRFMNVVPCTWMAQDVYEKWVGEGELRKKMVFKEGNVLT